MLGPASRLIGFLKPEVFKFNFDYINVKYCNLYTEQLFSFAIDKYVIVENQFLNKSINKRDYFSNFNPVPYKLPHILIKIFMNLINNQHNSAHVKSKYKTNEF